VSGAKIARAKVAVSFREKRPRRNGVRPGRLAATYQTDADLAIIIGITNFYRR
jgi:hypothetical protein